MIYTVDQIADYFIWRANNDEEFGDNITNLKLQKLVYYAQGFSLALNGRVLFNEDIRAWAHGPVVPVLYSRFKDQRATPLATPEDFLPKSIDSDTRELLEEVYSVYGQYSAWGLRNLTHEERPWRDTATNGIISVEKMKAFFSTQLTDV